MTNLGENTGAIFLLNTETDEVIEAKWNDFNEAFMYGGDVVADFDHEGDLIPETDYDLLPEVA